MLPAAETAPNDVTTVLTSSINPADSADNPDSSPHIALNISSEKTEKKRSILKRIPKCGLILIVFKVLLNCIHNFTVKTLDLHPTLIVFYRSVIILTMALPWTIVAEKPPFPPGISLKFQGLLLLRGVLSCSHTMADIFSMQILPLGDFQMISALQPIFVSFLARLFLKEAFGVFEVSALLVMISGVTCVIKPPFMFGSDEESTNSMFWTAAGVLLVSKVVQSNNFIILRFLRDQSAAALIASREILFTLGCFYVIMIVNIQLNNPTTESKLKVLALGCCTMMSSVFNILAHKLEEAHTVSLANRSLGIVFAVLTDIVVFNDVPDSVAWIGVVLVILAIIILGAKPLIQKRRKQLSSLKFRKCDKIDR